MRETRNQAWKGLSAVSETLELGQLAVGHREVTEAVGVSNRTFWSISGHCEIYLVDIMSPKCNLPA